MCVLVQVWEKSWFGILWCTNIGALSPASAVACAFVVGPPASVAVVVACAAVVVVGPAVAPRGDTQITPFIRQNTYSLALSNSLLLSDDVPNLYC